MQKLSIHRPFVIQGEGERKGGALPRSSPPIIASVTSAYRDTLTVISLTSCWLRLKLLLAPIPGISILPVLSYRFFPGYCVTMIAYTIFFKKSRSWMDNVNLPIMKINRLYSFTKRSNLLSRNLLPLLFLFFKRRVFENSRALSIDRSKIVEARHATTRECEDGNDFRRCVSLLDHKGEKGKQKRKGRRKGRREGGNEIENGNVREEWNEGGGRDAKSVLLLLVYSESGHVHCSALILDPVVALCAQPL